MLTPKAHIVCKPITLNRQSKEKAKLIIIISTIISHIPQVSKNFDKALLPFRIPTKYAEVPARNTNTGATKMRYPPGKKM